MKLHEAAFHLAGTKKRMQLAVAWLQENDSVWELRKKASPIPCTVEKDEKGKPIKTKYLPHIPIDPMVYARTWRIVKRVAKMYHTDNTDAWRILLREMEKRFAK